MLGDHGSVGRNALGRQNAVRFESGHRLVLQLNAALVDQWIERTICIDGAEEGLFLVGISAASRSRMAAGTRQLRVNRAESLLWVPCLRERNCASVEHGGFKRGKVRQRTAECCLGGRNR